MKLKHLLKKIPLMLYSGSKEIEITGITSHSKRVVPGNLFIAKKGSSDDGAKYIEEAIASGAVATLSDMGNPFLKEIAQLVCPHIDQIEGKLAAAFYGYPSEELFLVGTTGTNGKTTIGYLIKHFLDAHHSECGLLGTIECIRGAIRTPAELTTNDVVTNHKMLREMVVHGCKSAVVEVTSHALSQGRVDQMAFDVAIFTNLTQDHLDYHKTMDAYADAKAKLFESLAPSGLAIVNADSPWALRMIQNCKARLMCYGMEKDCDIRAHDLDLKVDKSCFTITFEGKSHRFESTLIGRHNVSNILAATALGLAAGSKLEQLAASLATFSGVRGRLEQIGSHPIFVDYAHTPDALEKVMQALKEITKKRLIVVFGCGGNRDQGKRPLMGKLVEKMADVGIVTSDNPRTEQPMNIIEEILQGFENKSPIVEPDRAKAIERAVMMADSGDVVLIAGKGHETVQIFAHQKMIFDDRAFACAALEKRGKSL